MTTGVEVTLSPSVNAVVPCVVVNTGGSFSVVSVIVLADRSRFAVPESSTWNWNVWLPTTPVGS